MRHFRGWLSRIAGPAVVFSGLGLLVPHAMAQTVPLAVGASIVADGLKFTVTGCSLVLAGGTATACALSGANSDYLEIGTGTRGANIAVVSQTTGGSILSAASTATTGQLSQLVYTLSVSAASGTPIITSLATTLAGSDTTSAGVASAVGKTNVKLADTLYNGVTATTYTVPTAVIGNNTPTGTTIGTGQAFNLGSSSLTATNNFASVNSLSVTTTLSLTSQNGQNLALKSVAQTFSPAPEPVSMGLFAVGIAGLGVARRNRARRRQA